MILMIPEKKVDKWKHEFMDLATKEIDRKTDFKYY